VVGAFGRLVERIADADNTPALRDLPLSTHRRPPSARASSTAHALTDPDLRTPASNACAALDQPHYTPIRHCTNCGWSTDDPAETTCDCPPYFTPARKD
jgi:hypothetical protein